MFSATDSLALAAAAAALAPFRAKGDAVWPGYDLSRRPLLVYFPDRWAVLLDPPRPVEGFSTYPDGWPPLGEPALVHLGSYGELRGQLEFNLEISGFRTVAVAPTQGFGAGRRAAISLGATLIVHEAFHQFQRDSFRSLAEEDVPEEEYPVLDRENTALASLEMHVLADAVNAEARGDTVRTRDLVEEFLAARRARWGRMEGVFARFERPQELMEGTAKYVEVRSVGLLGEICGGNRASIVPLPACDVFAGATAERYLLSDFADRLRGGVLDPVDVARNRVYPTGAALGLLLDFFRVDWKSRASDAASSPGLAELLARGLGHDPGRDDALLAAAKQHYGYDQLLVECQRRAASYEAEYQAGVDSLRKGMGTHVVVEVPVANVRRSRACAGRRLVLGHPVRSFSAQCHTYTLRRAGGEELSVEIHDSPIAEEVDAGGVTRRVEFVSQGVDTAEVDGRSLPAGERGDYSFHRLRLSGTDVRIRYEGSGTLRVDGQRIIARLKPPP